MSAGRPVRPTLLKLIAGNTQASRLRDDKPKHDGLPEVPPGTVLTRAEQRMFDWLLEHVAVKGVHGTGDGAAFVGIARLWSRLEDVDNAIARQVNLDPGERRSLLSLSSRLWNQVRAALSEVGGTPAGRYRTSGPRVSGDSSSWDNIK